MIQYSFCSNCGLKLQINSGLPYCSQCDIIYYRNAKPCAGILPIKNGKVLLSTRAIDPYKGSYAVIGGFMEADELPEAAAIREAKEETGLDIKITGLLGIYLDQYGVDGDYTLNIHYLGEITGGEMQPMDDVASLEWVEIDKLDLNANYGFQNDRDAIRDLKKLLQEGDNV